MRRDSIVARMPQQENSLAGCSKRSSSKAAGESEPEAYPQGYGEDCDEPRTTLADFFSILQGRELPGSEWTTIEMDEFRARIKPDSTVLQL
jgi:hypothetical protein